MKTSICNKCQQAISNNNFKKHFEACGKKVKLADSEIHEKRKQNLIKAREALKSSTVWNKGLTQQDNPNLSRPSLKGKKFGISLTGHTEETKKKISVWRTNFFKENPDKKPGGYKKGSGGGKKGWYKGFFCDSSWELAYVIYCLDHGIDIKRNTEKLQYVWQGTIKNYIPDFIVDGVITEIKGYKTKQWLAKIEANPTIKVLYEQEMSPILDYVKTKYGKNFIEIYDK
jgi:hypothetical protein